MRRYGKRSKFRAIATRPLRAGEVVTSDDYVPLTYDGTAPSEQARWLAATRGRFAPPNEYTLHNLNGCFVSLCDLHTGPVFTAKWRGELSSGKSVREVLSKLRCKFPRIRARDGEIIGYRKWELCGEFLRSLNGSILWPGPVMHADIKPAPGNCNGLYAVKPTISLARMRSMYAHAAASGFVGMYGRVVEHEDGYRAEHMVVRRILIHIPVSKTFCNLLTQRYSCDVIVQLPEEST